MKNIFFALWTVILFSCNNNSFISGSWTIDNLNSQDTSVNRETLLETFIAKNYTDKSVLTFSPDKVTLLSAEGKELGKGSAKLTNNDTYLIIKFPTDKMESKYKIVDKSEKTIKLLATDNGETIHISLSKAEK